MPLEWWEEIQLSMLIAFAKEEKIDLPDNIRDPNAFRAFRKRMREYKTRTDPK